MRYIGKFIEPFSLSLRYRCSPFRVYILLDEVERMADVGHRLMASGTRGSFPRCLLRNDGDNLPLQNIGERLVMKPQLLDFG